MDAGVPDLRRDRPVIEPALTGVALPDRHGSFDLEIADGRIASVTPSRAEPTGLLALPALREPHVHADRAFTGTAGRPRGLADAVERAHELRRTASEEDVRERAERLFERCAAHGVVHVRTHVDHDDALGERARRGVAAARAAFAGRIEVELVAFATAAADPARPETRLRLAAALDDGADLLGAVVAFAADPRASVDALLDLALSTGADVDLHLDETTDRAGFLLEHVADAALARGLEGRVTASHCCALAAVSEETARRTIAKVAAAGIVVVALPALNLYLQDRGRGTPRDRGVTLVHELAAAGVPVRFGSDNVQDGFFPYGDADPLESAYVAAVAAHVDDDRLLLAGVCGGRHSLAVGDPAELTLLEAASVAEAIARRPHPRTVVAAREVPA